MTTDEIYMKRCLQLALMAEGKTSPNPMVGAVIVHNGKIIGEGYHHRAGTPHAEPNAINSVADKTLLSQSTLYVSLEPCSHWGKTPPCTDLIIKSRIPHVVVAIPDPNPQVAGRGIAALRNAGIKVEVGTLRNEARHINRRFLTVQEKHRPYVILKWAQTADNYIDTTRQTYQNGPLKISNNITKTLNHQTRATEDAIMVATNTAQLDNPHLTITKWSGTNPLRILLDRQCRIPSTARIFDNTAPTLIITSPEGYNRRTATAPNIQYHIIDFTKPLPPQILSHLTTLNINSIIIEGGTQWLRTIIDTDIWDEARIETSPAIINHGIPAPKINGIIDKIEHIRQNTITHLHHQ